MTLERIINPNLKKLAERYSDKYPYPDVDEWIQFGEMVLFQNILAEKDAQKKLESAWNEIQCCDDVRLDQGLAVAIGDLQKLRAKAEVDRETAQKLAEEWEAEAARRGMAITRLQNGAVENKR